MIPQDIIGIGHSGIVSKAVTGDDDFCRGIFGHLLHVLRLHILGQADQQQAIIAHAIDGLIVDGEWGHGVGQRYTQLEHDFINHIQVSSFRLYPVDHAVHPLVQQVKLLILNGGGVPGFQIGGIQFENTEAHIQFLLPFLFLH